MSEEQEGISPEHPDHNKLLRSTLNWSVHNHGFVRYIDHMGTDTDIVNAARVSYDGVSKGPEADKKLLRYLFEHRHTSPFEMCKVKFHIKMPIFVARQFVRHRMQNLNEISARYTEMKEEFFLPAQWRAQDLKNKQSSVQQSNLPHDYCSEMAANLYARAYAVYANLLAHGVAREQARMVLPVGLYTEFYTCWDLNNLFKYFALRDDPHAQGEHQDYAKAMKEICRTLFPWTMEIYESCKWELKRNLGIPELATAVSVPESRRLMPKPPEGYVIVLNGPVQPQDKLWDSSLEQFVDVEISDLGKPSHNYLRVVRPQ